MNAQDIYSRQFGISELLALSWKMCMDNYRALLLFALILLIPFHLIFAFLPQDIDFLGAIYGLIITITQILLTLTVAIFIKTKLDNKTLSIKEAINGALDKFGISITTSILSFVLLLLLFIALIVPSIIFGVYWQFALYAVALHDKKNMEALRYSKSIVQNRWWKTFWYSLVFGILYAIVLMIVTIPFSSLADNPIINFIIQSLNSVLSLYFAITYVLFYVNFDSTKIPDAPKPVEQAAA